MSALAEHRAEPRRARMRRRLRDAALELLPEPLYDGISRSYWRARQAVRPGGT